MIELFLFKSTFFELLRAKRLVVWLLVIAAFFMFGKVFTMIRFGEFPGMRRVERAQNRVENRVESRVQRETGAPGNQSQTNAEAGAPQTGQQNPPVQEKPKTREEEERESYGTLSGWLVFRLLALVAAIFAAVVVAQEVEQKTIVYLLTRPIPRAKLLLARTAAAIAVTFLVGAVAAVVVSFSVMGGKGLSNDLLISDLKALFVGAAAYVSLFVLISLWLNRSMLICLLFAFGWETAIPNMPGSMYRLSIFSYLNAIAEHPSQGGQMNTLGTGLSGELSTNLLLPTTGYITMLTLTVICLATGAWWFKKFEYVPREDAE